MSQRKTKQFPAIEPLPETAAAVTPSAPETTEPPEGSSIVVAVAPPSMVARSCRQRGAKVVTPDGIVDAVPAPESPAPEEDMPKPHLSGEAIAAACRTLLLDYLTGIAGLPPAEAAVTADRAVAALVPPASSVSRADTKLARLIALLRRRQGATLAEMVAATGWQAHSVRGALSGPLKKKLRLPVTGEAAEGARVYRLPAEGWPATASPAPNGRWCPPPVHWPAGYPPSSPDPPPLPAKLPTEKSGATPRESGGGGGLRSASTSERGVGRKPVGNRVQSGLPRAATTGVDSGAGNRTRR